MTQYLRPSSPAWKPRGTLSNFIFLLVNQNLQTGKRSVWNQAVLWGRSAPYFSDILYSLETTSGHGYVHVH
jgi:predicted transposase YdaD